VGLNFGLDLANQKPAASVKVSIANCALDPALLGPEGLNLRLPTPFHKCSVTAALPRDSFKTKQRALLPFVSKGSRAFLVGGDGGI
jgi:hypothetical protein